MSDPSPSSDASPISSALPSTGARALAMVAIVVAGICGGLIGWKVTQLSTDGDSDLLAGIVGLLGAAAAAGGVAVVAVLVMRAMGEWQTIVETGDPAAARKAQRDRRLS